MALLISLKAIQNNTGEPKSLQSLNNPLETKYNFGLLNNLTQFISGGDTTDGNGILGHVLGRQKATIDQAIRNLAVLGLIEFLAL